VYWYGLVIIMPCCENSRCDTDVHSLRFESELLLSVPKQFVQLDRLVPALQTAFRIGLSYIPLAQVGLNALEHWLEVSNVFTTSPIPSLLR
jgi:hypothetical protein